MTSTPVMKFQENLYSFRINRSVLGNLAAQGTDYEALAAVESKLFEASQDFYARRYQDAIAAYNSAAALIYAHLDPAFPFHIGGVAGNMSLPRDPRLFDSLLSAGLEWVNVLPVNQPIAATPPRIAPDVALLQPASGYDATGILSVELKSSAALRTVADWQLARTYTQQGNTVAAKFFLDRAQATDAATFKILSATPALSGVPAGLPSSVEPAELSRPSSATIPRGATLPGPWRTLAVSSGLLVHVVPLPAGLTTTVDRSFGTQMGGKLATFSWQSGQAPPLADIKTQIYQTRLSVSDLGQLIMNVLTPSDFAASLPHFYYYTIPLGLAECYHALGDYGTAESEYLQAASYQYLNAAIEAPYLWQRLATLCLDWGNSLFRQGQPADAVNIYSIVLAVDFTVPQNSALYVTASLKPGADVARTVIANLSQLTAGQTTAAALNVNPALASIILEIYSEIQKIKGGLDFWGHATNTVPIWTFDYLQSAAMNFAQLAITAERDWITFQQNADQSTLTQQQLTQKVAEANAEVGVALMQRLAAGAEEQAHLDATNLAGQRVDDLNANIAEYQTSSSEANLDQALSTMMLGGDDGDWMFITENAGKGAYGMFGVHGSDWAAAAQYASAQATAQYEIDSMQRQVGELQTAQAQAKAEYSAAQFGTGAAQAELTAAQMRAADAQALVNTFNAQFFTPDVWSNMTDRMKRLYQRYLRMGIRAARLMQQAYNFETDQSLGYIKGDYSTDEVNGLLGADALMADIQSFTYDLITSKTGKPQPLKQTISLAQNYGFAFENQFRKTGVMQFETRIEDFDYYYPGTYAGRIEAVEVEVDGIVPPTGVSGTLTNSGISSYRLPSALWLQSNSSGVKYRIQPRETLVLSDYTLRQDALLAPTDQRMMRIFEGAGVASSWELSIPKPVNDIDYGALTDVRITFYYKARFDPDLRDRVLRDLATRPGINTRQRGVPLRWVYPDAFFHFQDTGTLTIAMRTRDFRANETKPVLTQIGLRIATDGTVQAGNLKVALSTPTQAATTATTDASGGIDSNAAASPWKALASGTALGQYVLSMSPADNPGLVKNGKLVLSPIVNMALIIGYSFTSKS